MPELITDNNTLLAETYTGKGFHVVKHREPTTIRCPYCGAELEKIATSLKGDFRSQDFHDAYMHIHYECKVCKVLLKENYVNEYGNWKQGGNSSYNEHTIPKVPRGRPTELYIKNEKD
jgi:hypothetical protein